MVEVFTKTFAAYDLLLLVSSVVLNPIVLVVIVRSKRLRSTSTFKILAFSAINDILACLVWNFESFTDSFFDFAPYFRSFFYCRWISSFLPYTTIQLESWLIVSIALDRLLSLTFKKWSSQLFTGYRPIIYAFFLAFIVAGVNFFTVFTIGYVDYVNGTEIIACFRARKNEFNYFKLLGQVNFFVF